jgi:hypothetical protein
MKVCRWGGRGAPGLGPAAEVLFFREKDPKPYWPCHGPSGALRGSPTPAACKLAALKHCPPFLRWRLHCSAMPPGQGSLEETVDQLAALRQGLPVDEGVRPRGQSAGVSQKEMESRMADNSANFLCGLRKFCQDGCPNSLGGFNHLASVYLGWLKEVIGIACRHAKRG